MDGLPPLRFDHTPAMPVIERVLPWSELQVMCFNLVASHNSAAEAQRQRFTGWYGCSQRQDSRCLVWRVDTEEARRHELAHCNGWPADHPR